MVRNEVIITQRDAAADYKKNQNTRSVNTRYHAIGTILVVIFVSICLYIPHIS